MIFMLHLVYASKICPLGQAFLANLFAVFFSYEEGALEVAQSGC